MKILFATNHLWNYTGSERNLMGLAGALADRGHQVACVAAIVSPRLRIGVQDAGLRLLEGKAEALRGFDPEVVFCQHHSAAVLVRSFLPRVPMALAHLGVEPELEQAPLVPAGVGLHLAISEEVQARVVSQGIPAGNVRIFRNAIDERLHAPRADVGPGNGALLFSYKMPAEVVAVISAAVDSFGMVLDAGSLTTHGVQVPEAVADRLRAARLVFASGRSALEAALSGATVIILGPKGLDGALTAQTWQELAQANFSGRRHARPVTAASLTSAIADALRSDTQATRALLQDHFSLSRRAAELESLLPDVPGPAMRAEDLALSARLAQLLHEQRQLAMMQRDAERDLQEARERGKPLWIRIGRVLLGEA